MKTIIAFSTVEEIYQILGWNYTGNWKEDEPLRDKLWDNGFNLDDWDGGFACKEPLTYTEHENGDKWEEPDEDVYWLVRQMEYYCVGYNHCEFGGYHWYTIHHS